MDAANEKAPRARDSQGFGNQPNNASNSATDPNLSKAISTQIAALALAGHVVHKGTDGDYTVSKWGLSRYCKNFAELQDFARQLGVRHGD